VGGQPVRQLALHGAGAENRQLGPEHLAVEGVGEGHLRAAPGRRDAHQTTFLEPLQHPAVEPGLEVGQAEPTGHGEQLQHAAPIVIDAREVVGHELVQARRGGQIAETPPVPVPHERLTSQRAADQLAEHLQVAT
jgi:hypothetical protein